MPKTIGETICAATDAERGLALLQTLEDETALADVARNAKLWEVRLAAVQRVTDPVLLEHIAEAAKHRDDRVYRDAFDILRARRRDAARTTQAAQLAAGFRGLLDAPPGSGAPAAAQLRELERALAELRAQGEVPHEVIDLAASAHARVQSEVQALRELGAAAALAEAIRSEIVAAGARADVAAFRERLAGLSDKRLAWLADHPTAAVLARALARAHEMLDEIAPTAAPAPTPTPKKKKERKEKRPASAPQWDEIRALLSKLEEHLGAGRLADAQEIEKRIASRAASTSLPAGLDRELKRHLAQLARMRDWAKWGDDQGREQLIEAAEALLTPQGKEPGKAGIEALAASVRALRDDWKKRDATRPASKTQWKRFDAILTRAFKPVLEFRARRAAAARAAAQARAAESRRREELIAKAEALKDLPVGEAIRAAIALQKAWQETGGVHLGRKDDRALWGRFHAANSAVFARRDEQRMKQNEERAKRDTERKDRDDRREAERRVVQQKLETHRGRFERLAARSTLIEKLEAAATTGGLTDELAAEMALAWKALPPLGMDGEKALQARLAAAPQATAAKLERGRAERDAVLLDLEVALGIPSPESAAAQRRERQLRALQERFKSRSAAPAETAEAAIARWYSIAAPADAAQAGRMTAVVRALLLQKR